MTEPVTSATSRQRVLQALDEAVAEHGLAATTVADIVRRAGTSRRTFYEHFDDREDAFLALYAARGESALSAAQQAMAHAGESWDARLDAGIRGLLEGLRGGFSRTHAIDVFRLGERGLAQRRRLTDAYAERFRVLIDAARPHRPPIGDAVAVAVVGGIQELILRRVERGETVGPDHQELVAEIREVVTALVSGTGKTEAGRDTVPR